MSSFTESPIPDSVRAVLELFDGPLADVRFPKVDRESLAEQVAVVEHRRAELQRALELVQVARATLEHEQRSLLDQARQAHAYASVFAAGDPELVDQLRAIDFDGRSPAPATKRGRKPKHAQTQTSLAERRSVARAGLSVSEDAA
jgi:hypothetical protein